MCNCIKEYHGPNATATANGEIDRIKVEFSNGSAGKASRYMSEHLEAKAEMEEAKKRLDKANSKLLELADEACAEEGDAFLTRYLTSAVGTATIRKATTDSEKEVVDWEGVEASLREEFGDKRVDALLASNTSTKKVNGDKPRVHLVKAA